MTIIRPFKLAALLLATLIFIPSFSQPAAAQDATRFFDATLGDFRAELATARQQRKSGILLMFEMEGCPYCKRMHETVLNRPEVQAYYRRHFLIYSVDVMGDIPLQDFTGRELREKDFANAYKIRGTPTFIFIGLKGEVMTSYTGATRTAEEFLLLGRYVVDGAYGKHSFPQFKQSAK